VAINSGLIVIRISPAMKEFPRLWVGILVLIGGAAPSAHAARILHTHAGAPGQQHYRENNGKSFHDIPPAKKFPPACLSRIRFNIVCAFWNNYR
jgi:hypothetical protein